MEKVHSPIKCPINKQNDSRAGTPPLATYVMRVRATSQSNAGHDYLRRFASPLLPKEGLGVVDETFLILTGSQDSLTTDKHG
jgi:hypothetical protein